MFSLDLREAQPCSLESPIYPGFALWGYFRCAQQGLWILLPYFYFIVLFGSFLWATQLRCQSFKQLGENNDSNIHTDNPDANELCHSGYNLISHELVKLLCLLLEMWGKWGICQDQKLRFHLIIPCFLPNTNANFICILMIWYAVDHLSTEHRNVLNPK